MGYSSGWMYLGSALLGVAGVAVPALRFHPAWQVGLSAAVIAYAILTILDVVGWGRRPLRTHVAAMAGALPLIGVAVWATGGAHSYLVPILVLAPIHWAFFLDRPRTVAALCAGLALTICAPIAYQGQARGAAEIATMLTSAVVIGLVAAAVGAIRGRLRESERRLRELTETDPLTGLLNRRGFESVLERALTTATPASRPAVVLLDLDHLKRLNDVHGHQAGDAALRLLGERLAHAARADDHAARVGGDEFAVVGRVPDEAAARRMADRLRDAVRGELPAVRGGRIEATVGWAVGPEDADDHRVLAHELLEAADRRLLAGKRRRPVLVAAG